MVSANTIFRKLNISVVKMNRDDAKGQVVASETDCFPATDCTAFPRPPVYLSVWKLHLPSHGEGTSGESGEPQSGQS